ncbi:transmembrane protein 272-like isoform X1 [Haliotis rufescens]|uniref:transmembrane protein 272-like isoform X1 n=1 Tax=Haliotis rufescens TaxID=6454 RepID=UPI001EB06697|nr:transmembrane protein 272-like isoform X1 [Haliotis rufescens]
MLGRAGTIVRKNRRRSSSNSRSGTRRGSAPAIHDTSASPCPSPCPSPVPSLSALPGSTGKVFLTPQPSPSKSVSFCLEIPNVSGLKVQSCHLHNKQTQPPEKVFYDSTVVWPEVEEQEPPFSVVSGICEAGLESRGPCEFLHRAFSLLGGAWPVTVFLVILLALPLVMTTIGVNYLHDCPREPKLPIYLVVGGCFGILKLIFLLWKQVRRHKEVTDLHDDEDLVTMTRMTNIALNIFLTIWFVFGHYWVVGIWKPHFSAPLHEPRNWCERTVFLFSFWQLVICHIIIALMIAIGLMLLCCYTCVRCLLVDSSKS